MSAGKGDRPSPTELADLHTLLQPEIEKRGYVMARSSRSADYFVYVRYPVDPSEIAAITFVRAPPTVPFLNESAEQWPNREYKRAIADMVAEPK